MGTAADNLTDYVYYPSEFIVSYLRWLESDGREGTNPPSAIKRMQVYSSGVTEASDFKESWMNDFPVGAYGDTRAKWYVTDLIYNSQGKGTRSTPRGGNWNLRTTSAFDDYNRKILSPQKEIEKNNCKVAFFKKQLRYRKGKEATPWKMIEYTIGEFRARFAICQIFSVQPIEPSQDDDVPLAAPAAGATSHVAGVTNPGPLLQEAQCSQEAVSSVEGHQLQQPVSDLNSRQDMNHQEVDSGDNSTSSQLLSENFLTQILGCLHSPQAQILQTGEKDRNSEDLNERFEQNKNEEETFASNKEDENEEEFHRGLDVPNGEQSCIKSSKEKRSVDECITNVKKKSKLEILASSGGATTEKDLTQAEKHKRVCNKAATTQFDPYSIDECMSVLETVEDVSDASYNKALEKFKDPDWRRMFIIMPIIRRKSWLKYLE